MGVMRTKSDFQVSSDLKASDIRPRTFAENRTASTLFARVQLRMARRQAAFFRVIPTLISEQASSFRGSRLIACRERSVKLESVIVHVHLAVEKPTQGQPDILVAECPGIEVEHSVFGILGDFLQQLRGAFGFGWEVLVRIVFGGECGVEIYTIQLLEQLPTAIIAHIWKKKRMTLESVHPPELRANVTSVQNRLAIAFDQEHDRSNAVVGIEERNSNRLLRSQINHRRRLQRYRLEQFLQMPARLLSRFQNPLGKVHTVGIFLKAEKNFSRCWRAVDERRFAGLQALEVIGVHMAEKVGQWRPCGLVGEAKVVDADVWEFFHFAVEC